MVSVLGSVVILKTDQTKPRNRNLKYTGETKIDKLVGETKSHPMWFTKAFSEIQEMKPKLPPIMHVINTARHFRKIAAQR